MAEEKKEIIEVIISYLKRTHTLHWVDDLKKSYEVCLMIDREFGMGKDVIWSILLSIGRVRFGNPHKDSFYDIIKPLLEDTLEIFPFSEKIKRIHAIIDDMDNNSNSIYREKYDD